MSSRFMIPAILFTISNLPLYIPWYWEEELEGIG